MDYAEQKQIEFASGVLIDIFGNPGWQCLRDEDQQRLLGLGRLLGRLSRSNDPAPKPCPRAAIHDTDDIRKSFAELRAFLDKARELGGGPRSSKGADEKKWD